MHASQGGVERTGNAADTRVRLPRYSVRWKLLLFSLVLVTVPAGVFGVIAFVNARQALEHSIALQLTEVAHDTAQILVAQLGEARKNARSWARQDLMREIAGGDPEQRVSRFLASVTATDPVYRTLLCTDTAGRVVAASDPALIGTSQGETKWFRLASGGERVLAGPAPALGDERPALQFAAPVYGDAEERGPVIGTVLGLYDWELGMAAIDHMREMLAGLGLTVDVLVLNEIDVVIWASGSSGLRALLGRNLREAGWAVAEDQPAERRLMIEPHTQALVGYARLDRFRPRWSVITMQPLEEALAPVARMQRQFAVAFSGVLLASLGVASYLARRTTRPLRELIDATETVGRTGGVPAPVPVRTQDEIGQLGAAFNRMGRELAQAQDHLVAAAKLAFVGEVAAGIAHEIRTPLSVLRGAAQILQRSLERERGESVELSRMIIAEVDRLDRVVGGLLEVARPREMLIEPTPLAPVLARAIDFVEPQARQNGIAIHRAFAPDLPPARCDPEEMYQVALNLIVNAVQMLPAGGAIVVRTLPGGDGCVAFEVGDNGPGIPAAIREHVFTPFFTMREGGTGLGLALAHRVVQSHHGSIRVDSEEGRGTTFRVELPAAERAA